MPTFWTSIVSALGGIGVFLIGMIIMTDGLKLMAGKAIRTSLMQYTQSPYSGSLFGALSTAVLQSSSAVTVATVGFVSAGMMTFSNSLGIIFGANIGTTITGWLVLVFGFKVKLGLAIYPLIFSGALLRLFSKSKLSAFGYTIAGFGIIFLGIEMLQESMSAMREYFDFTSMPVDNLSDKFMVLGFGILFTIVTQSSSAGVAATLSAMFSGLIQFEQAALLVIGMDIGTTVTALLATTGATNNAKRTGYSHVIYNILTGILSVFLIQPFIQIWEWLASSPITVQTELALISFHTTFNILGVLLILPFTRQFAQLIKKLFPERKPGRLTRLNDAMLKQPQIALELATVELKLQFLNLLRFTLNILDNQHHIHKPDWATTLIELEIIQQFIDRIEIENSNSHQLPLLIELMHSLDHIYRLQERCADSGFIHRCLTHSSDASSLSETLKKQIEQLVGYIEINQWSKIDNKLSASIEQYESNHQLFRQTTMTKVAQEEFDIPIANDILEGYRWLIHVARHIDRCAAHLTQANLNLAQLK